MPENKDPGSIAAFAEQGDGNRSLQKKLPVVILYPCLVLRFSLFNGVGAAFIIVSLQFEYNLSALLIECFWLVISIDGVIRGMRLQSHLRRRSECSVSR